MHRMVNKSETKVCVVTPRSIDISDVCATYNLFWDSLKLDGEHSTDNYSWLRLPNGSELFIGEHFGGLGEDGLGERIGGQPRDYDFIHFMEYQQMERPGYYLKGIPNHTTVVIEASGSYCGNEHHTLWENSPPGYKRIFLPWFLSKAHAVKFNTIEDRWAYEDRMNEVLESMSAPFRMPTPGYLVSLYEEHKEEWMEDWEGIIDFGEWTIDTENIKWYDEMYDQTPTQELLREFPTFSWEAFA